VFHGLLSKWDTPDALLAILAGFGSVQTVRANTAPTKLGSHISYLFSFILGYDFMARAPTVVNPLLPGSSMQAVDCLVFTSRHNYRK